MEFSKIKEDGQFTVNGGAGNVYTITKVDHRNDTVYYKNSYGEKFATTINFLENKCEAFDSLPRSTSWDELAACFTKVIKCECGVDKTAAGGRHSDWCPKYSKGEPSNESH